MPADTYNCIATTTLGSATATVTFSSISGSFTDLILITATNSSFGGSEQINCRLNSDTGSNYSYTALYGTGSASASFRATNATSMAIARHSNGQYDPGITHFQNYTNTNTFKSVISRGNSTSELTIAYVGLWRSTSAITTITLTPNGTTNFNAGSTFTLYGIKAE